MTQKPDPFFDDLIASVREMKARKPAAVHTPSQIQARRGRPVGSVAASKKVPVNLRVDEDVVRALRATGSGWQTRVNSILREAMFGAHTVEVVDLVMNVPQMRHVERAAIFAGSTKLPDSLRVAMNTNYVDQGESGPSTYFSLLTPDWSN